MAAKKKRVMTEQKRLYLKNYYLRNKDKIKKRSLKWWRENKYKCYNQRKLRNKIKRIGLTLHGYPVLVELIKKAVAYDRRKIWRSLRRDFEEIQKRLKIAA
jgi:hypothetical protein